MANLQFIMDAFHVSDLLQCAFLQMQKEKKQIALEGGLQPPTLWLTATRSLTN
jgi:hypothetical protein